MALWRLYYHFVWTTKERQPLIVPEIEALLYGYIIGKAHSLGVIIHAIGGIEDHIHIIASVPPKMSLADFVRFVKGASAYHINRLHDEVEPNFAWQRGYGVFSLGSKQLPDAVAYVLNQKSHHRENSVLAPLEECAKADDGPAVWNYGKAISRFKVDNFPDHVESLPPTS